VQRRNFPARDDDDEGRGEGDGLRDARRRAHRARAGHARRLRDRPDRVPREEEDLDDAVADVLGSRPDTRPTPVLREAVARVTRAGMSDLERLRALYELVNDTVTGDSGSYRGPSATLLQRAGDRSELFAALVRTAGIATAWGGRCRGTARRSTSRPRASRRSGCPPLARARRLGARPVRHGRPHGAVRPAPGRLRGIPALLASEAGGEIVRIPARLPLDRAIRFDVSLGRQADQATARGRIVVPDVVGYQRKQQVQDMSQDARRKHAEEWVAPYLVGTSLKSAEFPALTDRAHPFEIRLEATLSGFLSAQGASYVVPIGMPKTAMKARFVDRPSARTSSARRNATTSSRRSPSASATPGRWPRSRAIT